MVEMLDSSAGPGLSPDILEALREEGEKKYKAVRHQVLDLMDGHHPVIACSLFETGLMVCVVHFLDAECSRCCR